MPLTEEQFNKLDAEGFTPEEIASFEKQRMTEQPQGQPTQQPQQQPQSNILQQLLGATGNTVGGMVGGMVNEPARIIGRTGQEIERLMSGNKQPMTYSWDKPDILGGKVDIKPAENWGQALGPVVGTTLSMMALKGLINPKSVTRGVSKVLKYDNSLKQAQKGKVALDTLRDTLGKAKQIALEEVKDVPVNFDWKSLPEKAATAIKKAEYGIQFTKDGKVVNTIGNLDKVKTALQDLVTTKDYVEAGNMAKRSIMQFAGKVRDTMVNAADDLGKPELAKSLKEYHKFMDNYELINGHLVDKYGNAMANKLKSTFKIFSEPAIKESWKEVAKQSPEIKSVMKSMNHRELLKNLLKVGGGITALGAGKAGLDWMQK